MVGAPTRGEWEAAVASPEAARQMASKKPAGGKSRARLAVATKPKPLPCKPRPMASLLEAGRSRFAAEQVGRRMILNRDALSLAPCPRSFQEKSPREGRAA